MKTLVVIGMLLAIAAAGVMIYELDSIRRIQKTQQDREPHKARFTGHVYEDSCDLGDKCREKEFKALCESYSTLLTIGKTYGLHHEEFTLEKELTSAMEKVISETKNPSLVAERKTEFERLKALLREQLPKK